MICFSWTPVFYFNPGGEVALERQRLDQRHDHQGQGHGCKLVILAPLSLSVLDGLGESNRTSKKSTFLLYPLRLGSILNTLGENWDLLLLSLTKVPHTANTRPSHTCMVQEYQCYTISPSHFLFHEFKSIPWVQVYTIGLLIPWVLFNTISPRVFTSEGLHHRSMSITWVQVYTMSLSLY